ncbi:hypothetical protein CAPTEDRAFT_150937 [Capitella teleta]|uniref:Cation-transporting P-type ATPase C-terminal domain-containing protein n=1 Tax=Capitella teleta TaxID=283909 RepID=R7TYH0_CAPTE|nr:hypothetical protein CAPTEDRAFT_150937 [Capitella teleta]|eukprot:ELT96471.1 hypothetical protein CAPTEDRAFT_150937 [Capitella teleta]
MPMPNMFSVVATDTMTGMNQLFSQGTADLLLDTCSDFWDGQDLMPLTEQDRKKISDFYHRTSMSSYCTAFAYRPITNVLGREFGSMYLEMGSDTQNTRPKLCNDLPAHLSADSLIQGASMESIHETMGCLSAQCNQIFIGMITMQYQAKQEVVELIDALEGACIRFVHFSKENELRSRVFSEKMGLEAGWNCHISLLSEASPDADTSGRGASHSSLSATSHLSPRSVDSLSYQEAKEGRSAITLQRRSSAPSAVHLEGAQAKLPKGIENIRPHIESVDNVPLQVSLFTDCTPDTTQEMLIIFQEYGEVVCCLGSTANIHNTQLFLQADASLGLEPQFPQVCVRREAMSERWDPLGQTGIPSPYELSSRLLGLPCSLTYSQDDSLSVLPLIAVARHHCHGVRSALLLLLMSQLGLALLQFLGAVLLLPPVLPPRLLLWLSGVIVPLLCLCLLCNPIDLQVAKMAQAKKPKDALSLRFLTLYCVRFVPSILISLVCFGVTLHSLCQQLSPPSNSTSCHVIFGDQNYNGSSFTWNGWTEQYSHGLILAQNILAFQLLLYIICISLCYLQRFTYLWQKSPLLNIPWCCTALFLLILQAIYFAIDVHVSNAKHDTVVTLASVPMATWITAFLWLFILIPSQEVIKYMEIKAWVRHQKRARLDFGTKLGMNSPF